MEEDEEDAYPRTPDEEEINLNSLLPPKSGKSEKKSDEDIADRSSLVHPVLEGLRGDAFLVARDMGLDALAAKGGLDERVEGLGRWFSLEQLRSQRTLSRRTGSRRATS